MHKLMEYVCDELEMLEKKAEKDGDLSAAEVEYADKLLHIKKNLLKIDKMTGEDEFDTMGGSYGNMPYGRGGNYTYGMHDGSYARRRGMNQYGSYRMGYSRDNENMVEELRELMHDAPDEKTRMEFEKFIRKVEQM